MVDSDRRDLVSGWRRSVIGGARPLLLPALLMVTPACNFTRGTSDMKALSPYLASFTIEAPCSVAAANAVVQRSGQAMELDLEDAPGHPGDPWVLRRGPRLADPPLLYRVDVVDVPDRPAAATIRVFALPTARGLAETQETLSKPGALAMRIVAACAGGGAP